MTPPISTLLLHRYREGEVSAAERARVEEALASDPAVQKRWQAIASTRAEFELQPVPEAIRALSEPAQAPRAQPWWRANLVPLMLVGCAGLAGILYGAFTPPPAFQPATAEEAALESTRIKGGGAPAAEAWRAGEQGPAPLDEQAVLRAGDRIQLRFRGLGFERVTLAGRDGSGTLEIYDTLTPEPAGVTEAPFALTLDDAPGPQTFYVVRHGAADPVDVDAIEQRVADGAHVDELTFAK